MSDSKRKSGRTSKDPGKVSPRKENGETQKPGRRSVSLPPIKKERTPRSDSRVTGWHKRTRSLEPSADDNRKRQSRNTHGRFTPQTTTQQDVWTIYNAKPRLVTPYRPESSLSMGKARTSRPNSSSSRISEWRKDTEAAYDTVSQRNLRANNLVKKFVTITSIFDREAEKNKRERERKNREAREKFIKDLKERRREFAMKNYKRVDQQFVSPKVLEYEKDRRNSYGLPQNLLIDVDYPKVKKKPNSSKTSTQKHSQLPPSTKYGLKTDEKSQQAKTNSPRRSHDRSPSRQKNYQELYKIYCLPGNSRIKDWTKEGNASLAIAYSRRSNHADKARPSLLPSLRMDAYKSPYANSNYRSHRTVQAY